MTSPTNRPTSRLTNGPMTSHPDRPSTRPTFDPAAVARHEKAGWEAYYDRRWGRAFAHVALLNRAQFRMSWPKALAGALDIVRASIAFKPEEHDLGVVRRYLTRFYARARGPLGCRADAATLAALELDYWVVHRDLAMARRYDQDDGGMPPVTAAEIEPMVRSLTTLHAALFDADEAAMRRSAEHRARAAVAVDRITARRSQDVAADWREVEMELGAAYQAVVAAADGATE